MQPALCLSQMLLGSVLLLLTSAAASHSQAQLQHHGFLGLDTAEADASMRLEPYVDLKDKVKDMKEEQEKLKEESAEKAEGAYGYCLMGGTAVVMSLFYLVNHSQDSIRQATWSVLNMTISIFSAVLIFGWIQKLTHYFMGLSPKVSGMPKIYSVWIFVVIYMAFQLTLYVLKRVSKDWLKAAGTIFAHLTGFGALFLVALLQADPSIRGSAALTTVVAVGLGLGLCTLNFIANEVRKIEIYRARGAKEEEEENDAWQDVANDAENDMLSLATGFALMQAARHAICGRMEPFEPDDAPEDILQWETNALLACAVIFAGLVVVGGKIVESTKDQFGETSWLQLFINALPGTASMGMAFALLFWGEWQMYVLGYNGDGLRIAACLMHALLMSGFALALVFLLSLLQGDRNLGTAAAQLTLALGLLVGFSWERCFDMGLDTLGDIHGGEAANVVKHALPVALVCMALPAWKMYVLPKAGG